MSTESLAEFSAADLRPQESLSMGSQLHRILRTAIIQGKLKPGQAISEAEISKRFSISRQPVREAFIKLGEERLIEVLAQRGTYVRKISVKEVLDARHLREIIEVAIVRELALKKDDALIAALRQRLVQQKQVTPGDSRTFLELDDEFHKALAHCAGRDYAWRITEGIKAQMNRVRFLAVDSASPKSVIVAEHEDIVDAIESGNPDIAAQTMENHLRTLIVSLPIIAERYPEHFLEE